MANDLTEIEDEVSRLNRERRMGYPRQPETTSPPGAQSPDQHAKADTIGPAPAEAPPASPATPPPPKLPPQILGIVITGQKGIVDSTVGMIDLLPEEVMRVTLIALRALARGSTMMLQQVAEAHGLKPIRRTGIDSTVASIEEGATDGLAVYEDGQGRP